MLYFTHTLFLVCLLLGRARSDNSEAYSKTVPLMGTFVQVKIDSEALSWVGKDGVYEKAMQKARQLEKIFSIFDADSEINSLNQTGSKEVSAELFKLVEEACRISGITNGAFDITVAPILKANGFYEYMPDKIIESIPDTFDGVGWKNIKLDPEGKNKISLGKKTSLDVSGIAKGNIVDEMSKVLKHNGVNTFLINAGGDIYCGEKQNNSAWLIGIQRPSSEEILLTLSMKNRAVATSGDYENVVVDKTSGRLSHIIVPSESGAKRETFSSITVIAPSCTEADALATGMMAMGIEKAIELSDVLIDIDIIAVEGTGKHEKISFSKNAKKYMF
ncbi:MAG: FAD:protein FMN transferase [Candidatus Omnitrophota bacterium]